MASLHKHSSGRSPYFFASYQGVDGKFKLRSTKQTERSKAMQIALELERAAKLARRGELTEAQSCKIISEMLEKTTGDTIRHVATEKYLKDWLANKSAMKPTSTMDRYAHTIQLFLEHLGAKAARPLTAIAPADIRSTLRSPMPV